MLAKSLLAFVIFQRHDGCTVDGKHECFEAPRYSPHVTRSLLHRRLQCRDMHNFRQRINIVNEYLP